MINIKWSFIGDSEITCDEIIEPIKTTPINFGYKKAICTMDNFYILVAFLLITLLLLIIFGIYYYYYHIKHRSKQQNLTIL